MTHVRSSSANFGFITKEEEKDLEVMPFFVILTDCKLLRQNTSLLVVENYG